MLDNFLNQLRDNPRLRWGMSLIIGMLWLYAVLLLRDNLHDQTQQHRMAAQTIARLHAQLAQPEWVARMEQAKILKVQMEGRLWQAPTSGLAQAAFQDALNAAMAKTGATNLQITVTVLDETVANATDQSASPDTTTPADLWKIKAKLAFDFSMPGLLEFLNLVENHQQQIIVGAFNVRKEPAPHVEMELYGYFQKQAAPTTKSNLVPL